MEFKLKADFIELDNLLKVLELAAHGAQAKELIQQGQVKVNGQIETRVRRKLKANDVVELAGQKVKVTV